MRKLLFKEWGNGLRAIPKPTLAMLLSQNHVLQCKCTQIKRTKRKIFRFSFFCRAFSPWFRNTQAWNSTTLQCLGQQTKRTGRKDTAGTNLGNAKERKGMDNCIYATKTPLDMARNATITFWQDKTARFALRNGTNWPPKRHILERKTAAAAYSW